MRGRGTARDEAIARSAQRVAAGGVDEIRDPIGAALAARRAGGGGGTPMGTAVDDSAKGVPPGGGGGLAERASAVVMPPARPSAGSEVQPWAELAAVMQAVLRELKDIRVYLQKSLRAMDPAVVAKKVPAVVAEKATEDWSWICVDLSERVVGLAARVEALEKAADAAGGLGFAIDGSASDEVDLPRGFGDGEEAAPELSAEARAAGEDRQWRVRMEVWRRHEIWQPGWGPRPGQVGCEVPEEYL